MIFKIKSKPCSAKPHHPIRGDYKIVRRFAFWPRKYSRENDGETIWVFWQNIYCVYRYTREENLFNSGTTERWIYQFFTLTPSTISSSRIIDNDIPQNVEFKAKKVLVVPESFHKLIK